MTENNCQFSHNVRKYRLVNAVTVSFNTIETLRQTSQRKKQHPLDQRGPTTFGLGPYYKNVTTCGPLPIKWRVKQRMHKISN